MKEKRERDSIDLTDMIAAAIEHIPRVRRGVIRLYLLAIVIVVGFVIVLSFGE